MNRFIWRIKSRYGNCCQARPRAFQAKCSENARLQPAPYASLDPWCGILNEKDAFFLFETIHIVGE